MTATCREHEQPLTLSENVLVCPECAQKRAVRSKVDAMIKANPEDSTELLSSGEAATTDLPPKAKKFVARCEQAGWMTSLRKSETIQHKAPTKTGVNAGELKPDVHAEHLFVVGWTDGVWFQATWSRTNNKNLFKGVVVFDPVGVVFEDEGGTMRYKPGQRFLKATGEFEGWLGIVCPERQETKSEGLW